MIKDLKNHSARPMDHLSLHFGVDFQDRCGTLTDSSLLCVASVMQFLEANLVWIC